MIKGETGMVGGGGGGARKIGRGWKSEDEAKQGRGRVRLTGSTVQEISNPLDNGDAPGGASYGMYYPEGACCLCVKALRVGRCSAVGRVSTYTASHAHTRTRARTHTHTHTQTLVYSYILIPLSFTNELLAYIRRGNKARRNFLPCFEVRSWQRREHKHRRFIGTRFIDRYTAELMARGMREEFSQRCRYKDREQNEGAQ